MKGTILKAGVVAVFGIGALVAGVSVYAAIFTGSGDHIGLWDGPATLVANDDNVTPAGFTGPWHYHPGYMYNVVKQGRVVIEDGCGGTVEYGPGDAFEKADGRVHRAVNPYAENEVEISMNINPPGRPNRVIVPAGTCGPARSVDECKGDGWMIFNHPHSFNNQGECVAYVNNRRRVVLLVPEDPVS